MKKIIIIICSVALFCAVCWLFGYSKGSADLFHNSGVVVHTCKRHPNYTESFEYILYKDGSRQMIEHYKFDYKTGAFTALQLSDD